MISSEVISSQNLLAGTAIVDSVLCFFPAKQRKRERGDHIAQCPIISRYQTDDVMISFAQVTPPTQALRAFHGRFLCRCPNVGQRKREDCSPQLGGYKGTNLVAAVTQLPTPRSVPLPALAPSASPFPACRVDSRICAESASRSPAAGRARFRAPSSRSSRSCAPHRPVRGRFSSVSARPPLCPRHRSLPRRRRRPA